MKRALIGITSAILLAGIAAQFPPSNDVWVRFGRFALTALAAGLSAWAAAELVLHGDGYGPKKYRAVAFPLLILYLPHLALTTPTIPALVIEALYGAVAAAIYGAVWYARAHRKNAEAFDWFKFFSTVLLGALVGVGIVLGFNDYSRVSALSVEATLTLYAGIVAVVEPVLKEGWREFGKWYANRVARQT